MELTVLSLAFLGLIIIFYLNQPFLKVLKFWGFILIIWSVLFGFLYLAFPESSISRILVISSGYASLLIIMLTLAMGPTARVFKLKFLKKNIPQRRNLGVAGFLLGVFHYVLNWAYTFNWNYETFNLIVNPETEFGRGVILGFWGLLIFSLVAITSNHKSIKKLGRKVWKYIQLLSYPALLLVIFHVIYLGEALNKLILVKILLWSIFVYTAGIKVYEIFLNLLSGKK